MQKIQRLQCIIIPHGWQIHCAAHVDAVAVRDPLYAAEDRLQPLSYGVWDTASGSIPDGHWHLHLRRTKEHILVWKGKDIPIQGGKPGLAGRSCTPP